MALEPPPDNASPIRAELLNGLTSERNRVGRP